MNGYPALDALLAAHTPLPEHVDRTRLRDGLGLSIEGLAQAIGTSTATLRAWEEGSAEPAGHLRSAYAYFLHHARGVADSPAQAAVPRTRSEPVPATNGGAPGAEPHPAPCVLCGKPATAQVAGYPQHLSAEECAQTDATAGASTPTPNGHKAKHSVPGPRRSTPPSRVGRDPIREAVAAALATHDGDPQRAIATLTADAIPNAMRLLQGLRVGGRYDIVHHPALPEMLRKTSPRTPNLIWEGRPNWQRPAAPQQPDPVTVLDINGAYLSSLKTHLPLGQLQPSAPEPHDRRRAGIHLVTPPAWEHDAHLPSPLGPRQERGPLWITEPTLRLLLRLSGPQHALCDPPLVHESYTSGSTENLLEKFRTTLRDARARAIDEDDAVTLEYVKALYAKFVSTLGESTHNRELCRPDWMHIIRSQAFANLWSKAYKAHTQGLTLLRVCGTDELHLQGHWRRVFDEGRSLNEVKVKKTYAVAALYPESECAEPWVENRRYELAGGRYLFCRSCGRDLCTGCRVVHLAPAAIPFQYNDDNVCTSCQ